MFTATDFINTFNKAAASSVVNTIIDLRADLDFSQTNLFLPLGSQSPSGCIPFGGVLHGNGHSIKGLVMENTITENSPNAGLFCSLKNATFSLTNPVVSLDSMLVP